MTNGAAAVTSASSPRGADPQGPRRRFGKPTRALEWWPRRRSDRRPRHDRGRGEGRAQRALSLRLRSQGQALLRHRARSVRGGPGARLLAHAAGEAAWELRHVGEGEFDRLLDGLPDLPELDLSLHAELPKLLSPTIDRFMDAFADDDPDAAEEPFAELLGTIDTPGERARLARAVIALRAEDRLDRKLAAAALIDLACDSRELLGASLLQAVAVRAGAARTPAGVLLAA